MTAVKPTTAPPTILSGHCGVRRHQQCRGAYGGYTCRCECHTAPPLITVRCALGCRQHVEEGTDPEAVHAAMEAHYREQHPPLVIRHCHTCTCASGT